MIDWRRRPGVDARLAQVGVAAAVVTLVVGQLDAAVATRLALCVVQAVAVAVMLHTALATAGWASAGFVLAAAWAAIFTAPSVIYTLSPGLFGPPGLTGTIAVATAATAALALAYVVRGDAPDGATPSARRVELVAGRVSRPAAVAGYALGLAALAVIVANAGGPIEYLRRLDQTAGANAGLWYVVAVLMLLRWVPAAIIAQRWGAGLPAGRVAIAAYVIGTILLTLTGARLFIVLAVLEVAMLWTLLRQPIPLRRVAGIGVVVGFLIVFGLGTVKRFQSDTNAGRTDASFVTYATTIAPREAVDAYVNNYVDSVRLLGLARAIVPTFAPYEGVRPLKELTLKPLPSGIRPALERDDVIRMVFQPSGATAYAVPLQVNAYLARGLPVVVLVTLLIGACAYWIDGLMLAARRIPTWRLVVLVVAIIELPMVVRSGVPNGVATALTDVIGSGVAAWFVVRPVVAGAPEKETLG